MTAYLRVKVQACQDLSSIAFEDCHILADAFAVDIESEIRYAPIYTRMLPLE
jgi:hypothetical protein